MDTLEARQQVKDVLMILKPDEKETIGFERSLEEEFMYLRQIAQYVMLDKEALCRESYERGISRGREGA